MIHKKTFVAVSVAVALIGLSSSSLLGWFSHDRAPRTRTAWVYPAIDLPDLARHSDAIVLATAGATQFSRLALSEDGGDSLPFEITSFTVLRSLRGPEAGASIDVERTGGWDPVDETQVVIDADGGAYEAGKTYILFLMQDPTGMYYVQINDQARYELQGARLAAVDSDGEVARLFHRQPLEASWSLVRRSMGN